MLYKVNSLQSLQESKVKKVRLNEEITAPSVRLIGLEGQQVGVVELAEAKNQAKEQGYDLAEIAPGADPPVVKIIDWDKYRYEQTKQLAKSKKKQRTVDQKEVRLGLKIGSHDFDFKLKRAREFLLEGYKVKVSLRFRGREITRPELGRALLKRFTDQLLDVGTIEQETQATGREINTIIGLSKHAKTQNSQGDSEAD